jgi:hypothetical protein
LIVSFTFAATKGLAPYSWSETGALPAGLTFSPSGKLSGTPTAIGSSAITVTVEDSLQQSTPTPLQVTLQVFAHGFHSAATMKSPRVQHTATLLANGKVLVTGGDNTNPSTGELYDPSANTFTSVGNMSAAFYSHTATLLCDLSHAPCANDKVLIAGGPTSSAELFDPASSEFTPIANTLAQRLAATATLLPNGKVLLAGGTSVTTGVALSSAELFDPSTLTFASTGAMFPFFSALLGWLGVFLTGSDTSANALFGSLQVVTAGRLGMNPVLMASANSAGGVMGKMISLTSIAVAAAATSMPRDQEARLFRFTLRHSMMLASAIGLIVVFYAYAAPFWAP